MECCNEATASISAISRASSYNSSAASSAGFARGGGALRPATTAIDGVSDAEAARDRLNEVFDNSDEGAGLDSSFAHESYDLCRIMRGLLCSDICVPTPGSYRCKCHEGSSLQEDRRTCKPNGARAPTSRSTADDAETRRKRRSAASSSSSLSDTMAAATEDNELSPLCPSGYRFSSSACDDIDECVEGTHNCGEKNKCYNLPGSFQCAKAPVPMLRKKGNDGNATNTSDSLSSNGDEVSVGWSCTDGFRYDFVSESCVDVDECKESEDACTGKYEDCENTPGGFLCNCRPGFRRDEQSLNCVDLNECQLENHCLSSQRCYNTIGSYTCVRFLPCGTGYTLNVATENCEDDDECSLGTHDCPNGYHCRNTLGSYRCHKNKPGTIWATSTKRPSTTTKRPTLIGTIEEYATKTTAIDIFTTTTTTPKTTSTSKATINPWIASEPIFWNNPWLTSTPKSTNTTLTTSTPEIPKVFWITNTQPTTTTQATTSTQPTTSTQFTPSTQLTTSTQPTTSTQSTISTKPTISTEPTTSTQSITTTESTTTPTTTTTTTLRNAFTTTFRATTKSTPRLTPYTVKSLPIVENSNTPKTITRFYIPTRYTYKSLSPRTTTAKSIITTTTEEIPTVASLITTTKSPKAVVPIRPRLSCPPGFESDPLGQCIDIDECHRNSKICGSLICVNTLGSYSCELRIYCPIGYFPDPVTSKCKDLDECAQGLHKCGFKQTCENRDGGYVCVCPSGYEISKDRECVDVDECTRIAGGKICGTSGRCVNTPGSYRCDCRAGFEADPSGLGCRDVDECQTRSGVCQQECHNTWGGHLCRCRPGYRLKPDNRTCSDIDECAEFKDKNLCLGICDNTPGSYRCRCPDGYRLDADQRTCLDIDECTEKDVCKAKGETCLNISGGFRCNKIDCPPFYVIDPKRPNRCTRASETCSVHDQACRLRPTHYSYNYIPIISQYPIPSPAGHVSLFTMSGNYLPVGSTVRFNLAFVSARGPPQVAPATESCFAVQRPYASEAVLVLTKSLQGPQDIELEFSMEVYLASGQFHGSAVAKIFIIVTQYEF